MPLRLDCESGGPRTIEGSRRLLALGGVEEEQKVDVG
jgi:hypothetical protein